jgi:hypothetical protein
MGQAGGQHSHRGIIALSWMFVNTQNTKIIVIYNNIVNSDLAGGTVSKSPTLSAMSTRSEDPPGCLAPEKWIIGQKHG